MKNILKYIWWAITGDSECCPVEKSGIKNRISNEPTIIVPEISEEERQKIEISKKILDIVLKDLEKYPPSEWQSSAVISDVYTHECLSYNLMKVYKDEMISGRFGYNTFTKDDMIRLYNAFMPEYNKADELARLEKSKKLLEEFMDDSKRIICKENE